MLRCGEVMFRCRLLLLWQKQTFILLLDGKTRKPQLVKYKRKIIWAKIHVPVLSFLLSKPDVVIIKIQFQTLGNLVYFLFVYIPSPSSCMLCGWETVKHCMISYCCLASGFSESTSSGGLLSMRQLNVWLFLRPGSWGHGTPFTGGEEHKHTFTRVNQGDWKVITPDKISITINVLSS